MYSVEGPVTVPYRIWEIVFSGEKSYTVECLKSTHDNVHKFARSVMK